MTPASWCYYKKTKCMLVRAMSRVQNAKLRIHKRESVQMPSWFITVCFPYAPNRTWGAKLYLLPFSLQQMGLLMPAASPTEGHWTGQAQTKVPLQIPGISLALFPLVTVVSFLARAQHGIAYYILWAINSTESSIDLLIFLGGFWYWTVMNTFQYCFWYQSFKESFWESI